MQGIICSFSAPDNGLLVHYRGRTKNDNCQGQDANRGEDEPADDDLEYAIRDYVHTYTLRLGRQKTMESFGVSRYTLWRFLNRGHMDRALPKAVLNALGNSVEALNAATRAIEAAERIMASANRSSRNRSAPAPTRPTAP